MLFDTSYRFDKQSSVFEMQTLRVVEVQFNQPWQALGRKPKPFIDPLLKNPLSCYFHQLLWYVLAPLVPNHTLKALTQAPFPHRIFPKAPRSARLARRTPSQQLQAAGFRLQGLRGVGKFQRAFLRVLKILKDPYKPYRPCAMNPDPIYPASLKATQKARWPERPLTQALKSR